MVNPKAVACQFCRSKHTHGFSRYTSTTLLVITDHPPTFSLSRMQAARRNVMDVCQDAEIVKSAIRRVPTTMEATALKRRLVPPRCRPRRLRRCRRPRQLPLRGERCRLSIVCKLPPQLRLQVGRPDRLDLPKRSTSIIPRGAIRSSSRRLMEPLTRQRPRPTMPPPPPGGAPGMSRGPAGTQPSHRLPPIVDQPTTHERGQHRRWTRRGWAGARTWPNGLDGIFVAPSPEPSYDAGDARRLET
jgi:hypothetical protein